MANIGALTTGEVKPLSSLADYAANATAPAANTQSGVVGNNYVAQTPAGSTPAGTGLAPPTVEYTPPTPTQIPPANQSGQVVQGYLNDLLSQDSAYMRNAQQQGLNIASSRGLRNSSIAAGNAQQAAIEGSMPILSQIMGLNNQREQQAFTGEQSQFDRDLTVSRDNANMSLATQQQNAQQAYQAEQAALDRTQTVNNQVLQAELAGKQAAQDFQFKQYLQDSAVKQQDWLSSNAYNREFNGMLSQMQIGTAADLYKQIMQAALNDPETFTPEITAGMQNFFTGNYASVMAKYFPSTVRS